MDQRKTPSLSTRARNKDAKKWRNLTITMVIAFFFMISMVYINFSTTTDSVFSFYLNLANPYVRYVVIEPGMRTEEIADKVSNIIAWTDKDKQEFIDSAPKDENTRLEGFFMPSSYWININATGKETAEQMLQEFDKQVGDKVLSDPKISKNKQKINLETAVRIASIIQKEAAGKNDMNLISGVIWNRLFKGMALGMDATLQYAKGNKNDWWPEVESKDKKIDSPYNTYSNLGLTPTAISNISIDALKAAYNPQTTDCMYYLHDKNRKIHCAKTYEQHRDNIKTYLIGSRKTKTTTN